MLRRRGTSLRRGVSRRLGRGEGRRVEAGVGIDLQLSRQDVAEMTGTTLHTVRRTRSAWESQGIVGSGRQQVVIRKPRALVVIAEDLPPVPKRE